MHEVTVVNTLLGRYVLRFLDADAGRCEPLSTEDERTLAGEVAAVAEGLRARAERRDRPGEPGIPSSLPAVDVAPLQVIPTDGRRSTPGCPTV